ncbi:MAG: hypothetical protein ACR2PD_00940 [Luminiphilus sp.]
MKTVVLGLKTTSKTFLSVLLVAVLAACGGGGNGQPELPLDSDGDGVPDSSDAFPNDPSETVDTDGDGVGDNGDAFPEDPNESVDTDSDGVGDTADNCVDTANDDQVDSDVNGEGDACDAMPSVYSALGYFGEEGANGVSYTGQTARQVLQIELVDAMEALVERPGEAAAIKSELEFFITGDGADATPHNFTTKGGDPVIPGPTYADISSGKNLDGKIAGGNGEGGGETGGLINGVFFGWSQGLDADPLPIELVYQWIDELASNASDNQEPTILVADAMEPVEIGTPLISSTGLHYRQLIQKFLSVAVNFSQGTNDYLQADFANMLGQEGTKAYSAGAHDFDEAFGYYGASRDINDYTDDEAAGKGGRAEYGNGYYDSNGDGLIDIRSEFVFGHAQNCAKRDRLKDASGEAFYDFSTAAADGFLVGRRILQNAEEAQELTAEADAALQAQINAASVTWESCIAATVIHYINDVVADMGEIQPPVYGSLGNFTDLTKHWAEMKGFALGLQFSPVSPFRTIGTIAGIEGTEALRRVLSLMGDAPVLADGSQAGVASTGTPEEALAAYEARLLEARDILEEAYSLNPDAVSIW